MSKIILHVQVNTHILREMKRICSQPINYVIICLNNLSLAIRYLLLDSEKFNNLRIHFPKYQYL